MKTRNLMLLLLADYLNVYCKPHLKINLEAISLCVKEPRKEINNQTRLDGVSGFPSKVSIPVTSKKAKMLETKPEDMEINPPHSINGVGFSNPLEDWIIIFQGMKCQKEGRDGQIDLTSKKLGMRKKKKKRKSLIINKA